MQTTWTIEQLIRKADTGAVITAHWRCTLTDSDLTATAIGVEAFTPDPEAPGFVPFADLDEATVVGWVQTALGDSAAELEAQLAAEINDKRQPAEVTGLPWATQTEQQPQGATA